MAQRLQRGAIEVKDEAGLVDLHPFGAAIGKFAEHVDVNRQQSIQQRQRLEAGVFALGKLQERDRTDQHGTGLIAERFGFLVFLDRLARGEGEVLISRELRHHVVIVGVEPFCHFQRRHAVGVMSVAASLVVAFALRAARHRKIG